MGAPRTTPSTTTRSTWPSTSWSPNRPRPGVVQISARTLDALRRKAGRPPRYVDDCGVQQRAFIQDRSDRKSAICGRRAGKTSGAARWLLQGMEERPGTRSVYVGLSAARAKQIMWDGVLERTGRSFQLGLQPRTKHGQLMIRHPNGSTLWLAGCGDRSEVDKFRGEPFYRVVVDEAQAFPEWISELVEDAIEPSLVDYSGQLALCGTPSAVPSGYFYEVTTGARQGWSPSHRWTMLDNPHLPGAPDWLKNKCVTQSWGDDDPTYQREYLGRWVRDEQALVYPFRPANDYRPDGPGPYGLPDGDYSFGLGVDLGWSERSTAFVLCAARRGRGEVYVLEVKKHSRLIPDEIAALCRGYRQEISDRAGGSTLRIVVDEGGIGGGFTEQMRAYGVGSEPAKKIQKRAHQEYVSGLVRSGKLRLLEGKCSELLAEAAKLQWDPDTGKEDERFVRHAADATLYIVRALIPREDAPLVAGPAVTREQRVDAEMAARKAELVAKAAKRNRRRTA